MLACVERGDLARRVPVNVIFFQRANKDRHKPFMGIGWIAAPLIRVPEHIRTAAERCNARRANANDRPTDQKGATLRGARAADNHSDKAEPAAPLTFVVTKSLPTAQAIPAQPRAPEFEGTNPQATAGAIPERCGRHRL